MSTKHRINQAQRRLQGQGEPPQVVLRWAEELPANWQQPGPNGERIVWLTWDDGPPQAWQEQ